MHDDDQRPQDLVVLNLRLDEIEQATSDLRESINDLGRKVTNLLKLVGITLAVLALLGVYTVWRFS
jgi:hypothetical protein